MKTTGLFLQNLSVPCACACRYCFLNAGHTAQGVPFAQGAALARRFGEWRQTEARESFLIGYTIGYSCDSPDLAENILLNRSLGFPGAGFLQINGIRRREPEALRQWLRTLREAGADDIDATFFGLEESHDRFAGRRGDFAYLLEIIAAGLELGFRVMPSFVITAENAGELGRLISRLEAMGCAEMHGFLPDHRGRGAALDSIRPTLAETEVLPESVRRRVNWNRYRTEGDWLCGGFSPETMRQLRLSLTAENIGRLERMPCGEIVWELEAMDDAYYAALPALPDLARVYGNPRGERLYQQRDLAWMWRARWIREQGLTVADVTDEAESGTVRR
ncbi:MAG: hypothetical protein LBJ11_02560 [Oscillospiraceae bacterium]|jgi:hypothetical protein|nr:hypothetical protein [Oscillospiraceae bacterium]